MELTTLDIPVDRADPKGTVAERTVHDPNSRDCRAVGDILSRVGDKWSMLVIMTLLEGTVRFNELKRSIKGVSQQMLSRTLRALERDGLVVRTVYPSVPVRVEYELSPLGRSLAEPVQALGAWAFANRPAIEASRSLYDAQAEDC